MPTSGGWGNETYTHESSPVPYVFALIRTTIFGPFSTINIFSYIIEKQQQHYL